MPHALCFSISNFEPHHEKGSQQVATCDEGEAGCKRVGSIVEETDHIRSRKSAELSDRIDESEAGSGGRFAQDHGRHRPENRKEPIEEPTAQQQE